ncbi:MAG TPA: hypothetical protein VK430_07185 [Xanthobacteraceae bacterium]|nr:hypothetical protein [Xanthobacteraceae bacterium]
MVMAQAAEADQDKALWLTLAQSWVRLAEHVARGEAPPPEPAEESGDRGEVQPSIVREVC